MQIQTDAELINAYVTGDDQSAFAEIVNRHGAMVYRVCFSKLLNQHDAEDASQAVFMALTKNSKQMNDKASLGTWLYAVAKNTALFMARTRTRREKREAEVEEIMNPENSQEISKHDHELIIGLLYQELASLSAVQQESVILRYLDGLSEKDAALISRCAPNTLSKRVFDGISNLRKRLVKRGCTLGIPALIGVLEFESKAAIPQTLIPSLLAVPKLVAAGAAAGTASVNLIIIMEGTLKAMAMTRIKTVGIGIVVALLLITTGIVLIKKIQKKQTHSAIEKTTVITEKKKTRKRVYSLANEKIDSAETFASHKLQAPPRNFQIEAEVALAKKPKRQYSESLVNIMASWAKQDPIAASQWLSGLPKEKRVELVGRFFDVGIFWAQQDPRAAAQWAETLPHEKYRIGTLMDIATVWAERNPRAAAEWAATLSNKKEREATLTYALKTWVTEKIARGIWIRDPSQLDKSSLETATEWATNLSDKNARITALHIIIKWWALKDIDRAEQLRGEL